MTSLTQSTILRNTITALRLIVPLSVAGFVIIVLELGYLMLGLIGSHQKLSDWIAYILLGLTLPMMIILICIYRTFLGAFSGYISFIPLALSIIPVFAASQYIAKTHPAIFIAVTIQIILIIVINKINDYHWLPSHIFTASFVSIITWPILGRLLDLYNLSSGFVISLTYPSIFTLMILVVSSIVIFPYRIGKIDHHGKFVNVAKYAVSIFLFSIASLSADGLFEKREFGVYHHWGVIVGAVDLVRQGGWLYWDIPSQYGFLSILLAASMPFSSPWQATYVVNSILLLISSIVVFSLMMQISSTILAWIFSTLVTLAVVFLLPGHPMSLGGPRGFPSTGAFRYIWIYILLTIIFLHYKYVTNTKIEKFILIFGCLNWSIGCLWSVESAFYSSATWLPSYFLIVISKSILNYHNNRKHMQIASVLWWLTMPAIILLIIVLFVHIYYLIYLGFTPDHIGFVEYAVSFGTGFSQNTFNIFENLTIIIGVLIIVATGLIYVTVIESRYHALPLLMASWFTIWSAGTYFLAVRHPVALFHFTPIITLSLSIILFVLIKSNHVSVWNLSLRSVILPFFVIVSSITYSNYDSIVRIIGSVNSLPYDVIDIDYRLPMVEDDLEILLEESGISDGVPVVYNGDLLGELLQPRHRSTKTGEIETTHYRAWLPTTPLTLTGPLPPDRVALYSRRFILRSKTGGWIIDRKVNGEIFTSPWQIRGPVYTELSHSHFITKEIQNNSWRLTYYEYADLHNLTLEKVGEVRYVIEQINRTVMPADRSTIVIDRSVDHVLHVFGWAIDDRFMSAAGGVVAELGPIRISSRYGQDRPDIAEAFGNTAYRRSGFQVAIPVAGLEPGVYPLRILVLSPSKGTWYVTEREHFVDVR